MAEIKYQYAYDENGQLVSINDYTKHDIGDRLVYRKGCMELLKLLPVSSTLTAIYGRLE